MIREKVKNLWKLCFNDSEEFTELYFRLRYNNDINIAIQSGEEVIAALQMLPYPMTFEGEDIHTAYISGACTHPDYRNRGVMHELLSQAFARMLHNNVALSTLIPAEPWLFDYYGRSGYAPVFRYAEETFIASGTPTADTGLTLEMSAEYTEKRYEYLDRKLRLPTDHCMASLPVSVRCAVKNISSDETQHLARESCEKPCVQCG